MSQQKLYSVNEVCAYLRISRSTFYRKYAKAMDAHPDTTILHNGVSKRYTERAIKDIILCPVNPQPRHISRKASDEPSQQPILPGLD
ncbi:MAG: helix-turn-helix domain-containing protein [Chloroflexi bacterium]|nr:helix-turn-helix domain-containing protein [Chloroflexota bacterium]